MGTFAVTAIVDCRLSFANQGKQNSALVSVCSKQREAYRFSFPFATNKRTLLFTVS
jgi:hypothetical protein